MGEAVVAPDGRCALVSFVSSPLVVGRENVYVVYVTDAALAASAESIEWQFTEGESPPVTRSTDYGEIAYRPEATGSLGLVVRILDAGNASLAELTASQYVIPLNPSVEASFIEARDKPGPGVGNPDVLRELVNDHDPYHRQVSLRTPEADDSFQRFVIGTVMDGTLQRSAVDRKEHLDALAAAINDQSDAFATLAARGAGVCGLRMSVLAMTVPKAAGGSDMILPWTELPEPPAQRAVADEDLCRLLAELDQDTRIDLFNIVRCPKSNITSCGRIIEALRDRYFPGTPFSDVLTGLSGVRAQSIMRHLREGPILRT